MSSMEDDSDELDEEESQKAGGSCESDDDFEWQMQKPADDENDSADFDQQSLPAKRYSSRRILDRRRSKSLQDLTESSSSSYNGANRRFKPNVDKRFRSLDLESLQPDCSAKGNAKMFKPVKSAKGTAKAPRTLRRSSSEHKTVNNPRHFQRRLSRSTEVLSTRKNLKKLLTIRAKSKESTNKSDKSRKFVSMRGNPSTDDYLLGEQSARSPSVLATTHLAGFVGVSESDSGGTFGCWRQDNSYGEEWNYDGNEKQGKKSRFSGRKKDQSKKKKRIRKDKSKNQKRFQTECASCKPSRKKRLPPSANPPPLCQATSITGLKNMSILQGTKKIGDALVRFRPMGMPVGVQSDPILAKLRKKEGITGFTARRPSESPLVAVQRYHKHQRLKEIAPGDLKHSRKSDHVRIGLRQERKDEHKTEIDKTIEAKLMEVELLKKQKAVRKDSKQPLQPDVGAILAKKPSDNMVKIRQHAKGLKREVLGKGDKSKKPWPFEAHSEHNLSGRTHFVKHIPLREKQLQRTKKFEERLLKRFGILDGDKTGFLTSVGKYVMPDNTIVLIGKTPLPDGSYEKTLVLGTLLTHPPEAVGSGDTEITLPPEPEILPTMFQPIDIDPVVPTTLDMFTPTIDQNTDGMDQNTDWMDQNMAEASVASGKRPSQPLCGLWDMARRHHMSIKNRVAEDLIATKNKMTKAIEDFGKNMFRSKERSESVDKTEEADVPEQPSDRRVTEDEDSAFFSSEDEEVEEDIMQTMSGRSIVIGCRTRSQPVSGKRKVRRSDILWRVPRKHEGCETAHANKLNWKRREMRVEMRRSMDLNLKRWRFGKEGETISNIDFNAANERGDFTVENLVKNKETGKQQMLEIKSALGILPIESRPEILSRRYRNLVKQRFASVKCDYIHEAMSENGYEYLQSSKSTSSIQQALNGLVHIGSTVKNTLRKRKGKEKKKHIYDEVADEEWTEPRPRMGRIEKFTTSVKAKTVPVRMFSSSARDAFRLASGDGSEYYSEIEGSTEGELSDDTIKATSVSELQDGMYESAETSSEQEETSYEKSYEDVDNVTTNTTENSQEEVYDSFQTETLTDTETAEDDSEETSSDETSDSDQTSIPSTSAPTPSGRAPSPVLKAPVSASRALTPLSRAATPAERGLTSSTRTPADLSRAPTPVETASNRVSSSSARVSAPAVKAPKSSKKMSSILTTVPAPTETTPKSLSRAPTPSGRVPTPSARAPSPHARGPTPSSRAPTLAPRVPGSSATALASILKAPISSTTAPTPLFRATGSASRVPTPSSRAPTPVARLSTPLERVPRCSSRAPTPVARVPTTSARVPTPSSRAPTPVAKVPTPSARVSRCSSRAPTPVERVSTTSVTVPASLSRAPTPVARVPTPSARVPTPSLTAPTPRTRVPTPSSRAPTPAARVPTPSSRARVPPSSSRAPTPVARVPTPSARAPILAVKVPKVLLKAPTPEVRVPALLARALTSSNRILGSLTRVPTSLSRAPSALANASTSSTSVPMPSAGVPTPSATPPSPKKESRSKKTRRNTNRSRGSAQDFSPQTITIGSGKRRPTLIQSNCPPVPPRGRPKQQSSIASVKTREDQNDNLVTKSHSSISLPERSDGGWKTRLKSFPSIVSLPTANSRLRHKSTKRKLKKKMSESSLRRANSFSFGSDNSFSEEMAIMRQSLVSFKDGSSCGDSSSDMYTQSIMPTTEEKHDMLRSSQHSIDIPETYSMSKTSLLSEADSKIKNVVPAMRIGPSRPESGEEEGSFGESVIQEALAFLDRDVDDDDVSMWSGTDPSPYSDSLKNNHNGNLAHDLKLALKAREKAMKSKKEHKYDVPPVYKKEKISNRKKGTNFLPSKAHSGSSKKNRVKDNSSWLPSKLFQSRSGHSLTSLSICSSEKNFDEFGNRIRKKKHFPRDKVMRIAPSDFSSTNPSDVTTWWGENENRPGKLKSDFDEWSIFTCPPSEKKDERSSVEADVERSRTVRSKVPKASFCFRAAMMFLRGDGLLLKSLVKKNKLPEPKCKKRPKGDPLGILCKGENGNLQNYTDVKDDKLCTHPDCMLRESSDSDMSNDWDSGKFPGNRKAWPCKRSVSKTPLNITFDDLTDILRRSEKRKNIYNIVEIPDVPSYAAQKAECRKCPWKKLRFQPFFPDLYRENVLQPLAKRVVEIAMYAGHEKFDRIHPPYTEKDIDKLTDVMVSHAILHGVAKFVWSDALNDTLLDCQSEKYFHDLVKELIKELGREEVISHVTNSAIQQGRRQMIVKRFLDASIVDKSSDHMNSRGVLLYPPKPEEKFTPFTPPHPGYPKKDGMVPMIVDNDRIRALYQPSNMPTKIRAKRLVRKIFQKGIDDYGTPSEYLTASSTSINLDPLQPHTVEDVVEDLLIDLVSTVTIADELNIDLMSNLGKNNPGGLSSNRNNFHNQTDAEIDDDVQFIMYKMLCSVALSEEVDDTWQEVEKEQNDGKGKKQDKNKRPRTQQKRQKPTEQENAYDVPPDSEEGEPVEHEYDDPPEDGEDMAKPASSAEDLYDNVDLDDEEEFKDDGDDTASDAPPPSVGPQKRHMIFKMMHKTLEKSGPTRNNLERRGGSPIKKFFHKLFEIQKSEYDAWSLSNEEPGCSGLNVCDGFSDCDTLSSVSWYEENSRLTTVRRNTWRRRNDNVKDPNGNVPKPSSGIPQRSDGNGQAFGSLPRFMMRKFGSIARHLAPKKKTKKSSGVDGCPFPSARKSESNSDADIESEARWSLNQVSAVSAKSPVPFSSAGIRNSRPFRRDRKKYLSDSCTSISTSQASDRMWEEVETTPKASQRSLNTDTSSHISNCDGAELSTLVSSDTSISMKTYQMLHDESGIHIGRVRSKEEDGKCPLSLSSSQNALNVGKTTECSKKIASMRTFEPKTSSGLVTIGKRNRSEYKDEVGLALARGSNSNTVKIGTKRPKNAEAARDDRENKSLLQSTQPEAPRVLLEQRNEIRSPEHNESTVLEDISRWRTLYQSDDNGTKLRDETILPKVHDVLRSVPPGDGSTKCSQNLSECLPDLPEYLTETENDTTKQTNGQQPDFLSAKPNIEAIVSAENNALGEILKITETCSEQIVELSETRSNRSELIENLAHPRQQHSDHKSASVANAGVQVSDTEIASRFRRKKNAVTQIDSRRSSDADISTKSTVPRMIRNKFSYATRNLLDNVEKQMIEVNKMLAKRSQRQRQPAVTSQTIELDDGKVKITSELISRMRKLEDTVDRFAREMKHHSELRLREREAMSALTPSGMTNSDSSIDKTQKLRPYRLSSSRTDLASGRRFVTTQYYSSDSCTDFYISRSSKSKKEISSSSSESVAAPQLTKKQLSDEEYPLPSCSKVMGSQHCRNCVRKNSSHIDLASKNGTTRYADEDGEKLPRRRGNADVKSGQMKAKVKEGERSKKLEMLHGKYNLSDSCSEPETSANDEETSRKHEKDCNKSSHFECSSRQAKRMQNPDCRTHGETYTSGLVSVSLTDSKSASFTSSEEDSTEISKTVPGISQGPIRQNSPRRTNIAPVKLSGVISEH